MLDIRFNDWVIKDYQSGRIFSFALYDGGVIIKIRAAEKGARDLFYRRIDPICTSLISKVIDKVMAGSPENKLPVKFSTFDRQSKQQRLDWVFTFEKDAKMCYRIHVTDVATNTTHVFALKGPQMVSIGSDIMSDADKSSLKARELLDWFASAKIWGPATKRPFDPSKKPGGGGGFQRGPGGGGNGGGWKGNGGGGWKGNNGGGGWKGNGGGGYNNGGSNGSANPPPPAPAEDPDGLPF